MAREMTVDFYHKGTNFLSASIPGGWDEEQATLYAEDRLVELCQEHGFKSGGWELYGPEGKIASGKWRP